MVYMRATAARVLAALMVTAGTCREPISCSAAMAAGRVSETPG